MQLGLDIHLAVSNGQLNDSNAVIKSALPHLLDRQRSGVTTAGSVTMQHLFNNFELYCELHLHLRVSQDLIASRSYSEGVGLCS